MTVVEEDAEAPLAEAGTVSEAETAAEAEDGAETPSSDVPDENPSPADAQTDTPGEDTPVREEDSKPETATE